MSEAAQEERVFIGMPGYGHQTAAAGRALWFACEDAARSIVKYQCGSLLAANFNVLWSTALNMQRKGIPIKYFAMLHDDIGPEDLWADVLIDEMEDKGLDMLGVASPIKDGLGLTSIALHNEKGDNWSPLCRLTMKEIHRLPETFTSKDVGHPLLLNTGCWVCKFDPAWNSKVYFTINDRIVFDKNKDAYTTQVESEDWFFSRLCHEQGLKIGCTRKVKLTHRGEMDFPNTMPWGTSEFDRSFLESSLIPESRAEQSEQVSEHCNPAVEKPPALVYSEV